MSFPLSDDVNYCNMLDLELVEQGVIGAMCCCGSSAESRHEAASRGCHSQSKMLSPAYVRTGRTLGNLQAARAPALRCTPPL
eukprot:5099652-Amphidinium_carterae.1